jgi:hypothetical protein
MLVERIPWPVWLLVVVVFLIASAIQKPKESSDLLPKVRAEDEPRILYTDLPLIGHVLNYLNHGPAYLYRLW